MRQFMLAAGLFAALTACSNLPDVDLTATGFSVPRYTDYPTLTIYNVTNSSNMDVVEQPIEVRCLEHTFEELPMTFEASFTLPAGATQDIRVPYADGFPYMTDLRVACSFDVPSSEMFVSLEFP